MFNENHYVPIIKWKRGEQKALEYLGESLKNMMTPLIEIPPIEWDYQKGEPKKTIDEHLKGIGASMSKSWNHEGPIFIDAFNVCTEDVETMESGQHPLEFIINEINNENFTAIPVTSMEQGKNYQGAVKGLLETYEDGYCLRLTDKDFDDAEKTFHIIRETFGDNFNETDLIIDFQYLDPEYESRMKKMILSIFNEIPDMSSWRTFTFCGTAFPKVLSEKIPTGSDGYIRRVAWTIYKSLRKKGLERIPAFGDYNISHTDYLEIDPRVMQMAASIRYTIDEDFLILRGYSVKDNGWGQMVDLTKRLVNNREYAGKDFSYGDQYIYDCCLGNETTGNAETWRRVGANHHLSFVINQLSNLYEASTVR